LEAKDVREIGKALAPWVEIIINDFYKELGFEVSSPNDNENHDSNVDELKNQSKFRGSSFYTETTRRKSKKTKENSQKLVMLHIIKKNMIYLV